MTFDPRAAAVAIAAQHRNREAFANLSGDLAPPTIDDAYDAQEALAETWVSERGPVIGRKIATTTRVMQELMGIDHPCGGLIYQKTVHETGAALKRDTFVNVMIECELAVTLGQDLPAKSDAYTRDEVRAAVGTVMAAFELIEDRNAVYKTSDARTLIADNAWNGGIVVGQDVTVDRDFELNALRGATMVNGRPHGEGLSDDPMGALAWVANLAIARKQPMTKGMTVITGSLIPTFAVEAGDRIHFEIDHIGTVDLSIT
ncbi:MAG: fumarylacetoacetate hydrolase family protein [Pseudomonadota bacterium]